MCAETISLRGRLGGREREKSLDVMTCMRRPDDVGCYHTLIGSMLHLREIFLHSVIDRYMYLLVIIIDEQAG